MEKLLASVMISFLVILLIWFLSGLLEMIRCETELTALKFYPLVIGGFSLLVSIVYNMI